MVFHRSTLVFSSGEGSPGDGEARDDDRDVQAGGGEDQEIDQVGDRRDQGGDRQDQGGYRGTIVSASTPFFWDPFRGLFSAA